MVDTGSTHNFIQTEVAKSLKIPIYVIKEFLVTTGSGDKLFCNRMCKETKIIIQGISITTDLYLVSMADSNVIMGIQWMKTLGPIISDFSEILMTFQWEGQTVKWRGEPSISEDPFTNAELQHLSADITEAFLLHFELCQDENNRNKDRDIPNLIQPLVAQFNDLFLELVRHA